MDKREKPTTNIRNVSPHEITHIIRDLPGLVDTFCGGEWEKWPTLSPQLLCVTQRVNPTVGESGGMIVVLQTQPTQPHTVTRGWHLMATENDNTERKMFALTLYAPFPPPTTTPTRESQISVSAWRELEKDLKSDEAELIASNCVATISYILKLFMVSPLLLQLFTLLSVSIYGEGWLGRVR